MTVPNLADCKAAFAGRPLVERYYCTCGAVFEGFTQADVRRQQFEHRLTVSTSPADENNHEGVAW